MRTQLQQAAALTRRGAGVSEQRILSAARAFLREQDHIGHTDPPRMVVKTARRLVARSPRPKPTARTREQNAAEKARKILKRLRREGNALPRTELASLTQELFYLAGRAGTLLDLGESRAVGKWLRKTHTSWSANDASAPHATSRPAGSASRPVRKRGNRPDLDQIASGVKTILQRAAAQGTTLTWAQVREQLPSGIPRLRRSDEVAVLVRVDSRRGRRDGLLSALVTGPDHDMHPSYPKVVAGLGLRPASGHLEAIAAWAVEVSRLTRGGSRRTTR